MSEPENEKPHNWPLRISDIEWIRRDALEDKLPVPWHLAVRLCDVALGKVPISPERPAIGSAQGVLRRLSKDVR